MRTVLIAALCSAGCSDSRKSDEVSDFGPAQTIWAGWNHHWDFLSHRVSQVTVRSIEDGVAESGIRGGDWAAGASWSDEVNYRIHQQNVAASDLSFTEGQTTLMVGPSGPASAILDLEAADLVVLQGFALDTDQPLLLDDDSPAVDYDPALGFTSRGFGVEIASDGEQWSVTAEVNWGPRDRTDMNAAIPYAQTEVTLYWTAVEGFERSTPVAFEGSTPLAHSPPNSPQSGHTEALDLAGHGFIGLLGFNLALDDTDGGDGGDYLRSFGVEFPPTEDGGPPSTASAEILNTAPIELGEMTMGFEVNAVWVEVDANSSAITGETLFGTHAIGNHRVTSE